MIWLVGLAVLVACVALWRGVEHLTLKRLQRDAGVTDDDFKPPDPTPRQVAASLFAEGKSVAEVREELLSRGVAPADAEALSSELRPRRKRIGEAELREADAYEASLLRGRYDANGHVAVGAALQVAVVGGLVGGAAMAIAARLSEEGDPSRAILFGVGIPVGLLTAVITFRGRGRWQRVEIYASHYCSGSIQVSLMYVPLVAFVYANVLLVRDLVSKGASRVAREALEPRREPEEPTDTAPRVVGSPCAHCQRRIVSQLQGTRCPLCQRPVHRACRKDHRAEAHPGPARAASR